MHTNTDTFTKINGMVAAGHMTCTTVLIIRQKHISLCVRAFFVYSSRHLEEIFQVMTVAGICWMLTFKDIKTTRKQYYDANGYIVYVLWWDQGKFCKISRIGSSRFSFFSNNLITWRTSFCSLAINCIYVAYFYLELNFVRITHLNFLTSL